MKEIYMSVSIVDFGNGHITCRFCEAIGDEPIRIKELELNKARRLMWELVLAGGKRSVQVNTLDHTIISSGAYIFLPI